MTEFTVASILNRYLGKYVSNLDEKGFSIGIYKGQITLQQLRLKPEALCELGLPIDVKIGTIDKLHISIPWNGLVKNEPIVVDLENLFILAGPITNGQYDEKKEEQLMRAEKLKILRDLDELRKPDREEYDVFGNWLERIKGIIKNNLIINIQGIHIRYEDGISSPEMPIALGITLQNFTMDTISTNEKWKATSTCKKAPTCQVIKMETLCVYCNTNSSILNNVMIDEACFKTLMKEALETFCIKEERFNFVMKPTCLNGKITVKEETDNKLMINFEIALQDVDIQLNHHQYLAIIQTCHSFPQISVNRRYLKFHPKVPIRENGKKWWLYALNGILLDKIRPYQWDRIKRHRNNCRIYGQLYKDYLTNQFVNEDDIKKKLIDLEDLLDVYNLILIRQQIKSQVRKDFPEKVSLVKKIGNSFSFFMKKKEEWFLWASKDNAINASDGIEGQETYMPVSTGKTEYRFSMSIVHINLYLTSGGIEILIALLSRLSFGYECTRKDSFKISTIVEGITIEGASVEDGLTSILSPEITPKGVKAGNVISFKFQKDPGVKNLDYKLDVSSSPLAIVYHEYALSTILSFLDNPLLKFKRSTSAIENMKNTLNEEWLEIILKQKIQINLDLKLPFFVFPEYGNLKNSKGNTIIVDLGILKSKNNDVPLFESKYDTKNQDCNLFENFDFHLRSMQILILEKGQNFVGFKEFHRKHFHILQKTDSKISFSHGIAAAGTLPRYKVKVHVGPLKVNLSNDRLISFARFHENFPLPVSHTVMHEYTSIDLNHVVRPTRMDELRDVQIAKGSDGLKDEDVVRSNEMLNEIMNMTSGSRGSTSSDEPDMELLESWMNSIQTENFNDLVSPHNNVQVTFNAFFNQITLEMQKSHENIDRQFLVFEGKDINFEAALMSYGQAIYLSIKSINVINKCNTIRNCATGKIINACGHETDFVKILYRKIRSDCPDFKEYYHNAEQSLIIHMKTIELMLHDSLLLTINLYYKTLYLKLKDKPVYKNIATSLKILHNSLKKFCKSRDTPVAVGATKFSYSIRIAAIEASLSDTVQKLFLIAAKNVEFDCILKTNGYVSLKAYIESMIINDDSDECIYGRVFSGDMMELKYVYRERTKLIKNLIETNNVQNESSSDGQLRLNVASWSLVIDYTTISMFMNFMACFTSREKQMEYFNNYWSHLCDFIMDFRPWEKKVKLSINLGLPTILIPYEKTTGRMFFFYLGKLSLENFFNSHCLTMDTDEYNEKMDVNDITLKINGLRLESAAITENQYRVLSRIINPIQFTIETKILLSFDEIVNKLPPECPVPDWLVKYQVFVTMDNVRINLGTCDTVAMNLAWEDNIQKIIKINNGVNKTKELDENIERLQAFVTQPDRKLPKSIVEFVLDKIVIVTTLDTDETPNSRRVKEPYTFIEICQIFAQRKRYNNRNLYGSLKIQSAEIDDERKIKIKDGVKRVLTTIEGIQNCLAYQYKLTNDEVRKKTTIAGVKVYLSISFWNDTRRFTDPILTLFLSLDSLLNENSRKCERNGGKHLLKTYTTAVLWKYPNVTIVCNSLTKSCDIKTDFLRLNANKLELCYKCYDTCETFETKCIKLFITSPSKNEYIILNPCDMTVNLTCENIKEEIITMDFTPLFIRITPSTIDILMNMLRDFNCIPPDDYKEDEILEDEHTPSYRCEDTWRITSLSTAVDPLKKAEAVGHTKRIEKPEPIKQNWTINIPESNIFFEGQHSSRCLPLLVARMSTKLKVKDDDYDELDITCETTLECSYYNWIRNVWEYVIQPCVKPGNKYEPWNFNFKLFHFSRYNIESDDDINPNTHLPPIEPEDPKKPQKEPSMRYFQILSNGKRVPSLINGNRDVLGKDELDLKLEPLDVVKKDLAASFNAVLSGDTETNVVNAIEDDGETHGSTGEKIPLEQLLEDIAKFDVYDVHNRNYATYITMESKNRLELTVSEISIEIMRQLYACIFQKKKINRNIVSPTSLGEPIKVQCDIGSIAAAAYFIVSEDGTLITIASSGHPYSITKPEVECRMFQFYDNFQHSCSEDESVFDRNKAMLDEICSMAFVHSYNDNNTLSKKIEIQLAEFNTMQIVCPTVSCEKLYPIRSAKNSDEYHLLLSVIRTPWKVKYLIQSPLIIENDTSYAFALHYKRAGLPTEFDEIGDPPNPFEEFNRFGILAARSSFHVPIQIAYDCPIYIGLAYDEFHPSETNVWWKEMEKSNKKTINFLCRPKNPDSDKLFAAKATLEERKLTDGPTPENIPCYKIVLKPSCTLHNATPYKMFLNMELVKWKTYLDPLETIDINHFDMSTKTPVTVFVLEYFNSTWQGSFELSDKIYERIFTLECQDENMEIEYRKVYLNIGVVRSSTIEIIFHTTFSIVNATDLDMEIKGAFSNKLYLTSHEKETYLTLKDYDKNQICIKVAESRWSSPFAVDSTCCVGNVICSDPQRSRKYQILVDNRFWKKSPHFVNSVAFYPFFQIQNESDVLFRYMEKDSNADLWIDLETFTYKSFWPRTNSMQICLKYANSKNTTKFFFINKVHDIVLPTADNNAGITVRVTGGGRKPFLISVNKFVPEDELLRIDNHTTETIQLYQKGESKVYTVHPSHTRIFNWENPTGEKSLYWTCGYSTEIFKAFFLMDGHGVELVETSKEKNSTKKSNNGKKNQSKGKKRSHGGEDNSKNDPVANNDKNVKDVECTRKRVYWISYIDTCTRVLLFNLEEALVKPLCYTLFPCRSKKEIMISMEGIGISIINEYNGKAHELAYISINHSPAVWEFNVGTNQWYEYPMQVSIAIEDQYQKGVESITLFDYVSVNITEMKCTKPHLGHIRRKCKPALLYHARKGDASEFTHCQIQRIQIDNQLLGARCPNFLSPLIKNKSYSVNSSFEFSKYSVLSLYSKHRFQHTSASFGEFIIQVETEFVKSFCKWLYPFIKTKNKKKFIELKEILDWKPNTWPWVSSEEKIVQKTTNLIDISPIRLLFDVKRELPSKRGSKKEDELQLLIMKIMNDIYEYDEFKKITITGFENNRIMEESGLDLWKEIKEYYQQEIARKWIGYFKGGSVLLNDGGLLTDNFTNCVRTLFKKQSKYMEYMSSYIMYETFDLLHHLTDRDVFNLISLLNPQVIASSDQELKYDIDNTPLKILERNLAFNNILTYGISGLKYHKSKTSTNGTNDGVSCNAYLYFNVEEKKLTSFLASYHNEAIDNFAIITDAINRKYNCGTKETSRRRPPLHISPMKGIKGFNVNESMGMSLLHKVNDGIFSGNDYYAHVHLMPSANIFIITHQRVILARYNCMCDKLILKWSIEIQNIVKMFLVGDQLIFYHTQPKNDRLTEMSLLEENDTDVMKWLCDKVNFMWKRLLQDKPYYFDHLPAPV